MSARVGVDIGGTFTDVVLRLAEGTLRVKVDAAATRALRERGA